jgi:hypothetical protein
LRKKPVGETIVVTDLPKGNFYVVTSVDKKEPTFANFGSEVFAKSAAKIEVDPLYSRYVMERSNRLLITVIDRLKAEAKYTETEEYKKLMTKKETVEEE